MPPSPESVVHSPLTPQGLPPTKIFIQNLVFREVKLAFMQILSFLVIEKVGSRITGVNRLNLEKYYSKGTHCTVLFLRYKKIQIRARLTKTTFDPVLLLMKFYPWNWRVVQCTQTESGGLIDLFTVMCLVTWPLNESEFKFNLFHTICIVSSQLVQLVVSSIPARRTLRGFKQLRRKCCPCNYIRKWLDFQVFSDKNYKP